MFMPIFSPIVEIVEHKEGKKDLGRMLALSPLGNNLLMRDMKKVVVNLLHRRMKIRQEMKICFRNLSS